MTTRLNCHRRACRNPVTTSSPRYSFCSNECYLVWKEEEGTGATGTITRPVGGAGGRIETEPLPPGALYQAPNPEDLLKRIKALEEAVFTGHSRPPLRFNPTQNRCRWCGDCPPFKRVCPGGPVCEYCFFPRAMETADGRKWTCDRCDRTKLMAAKEDAG